MQRNFCDRCGMDVTEDKAAAPARAFTAEVRLYWKPTDRFHLCAPCYEQFGDWLKAGVACPTCSAAMRRTDATNQM